MSLSPGVYLSAEPLVAKAHTHGRLTSNYGHFAANVDCIGFWSRSIGFSKDVCYRVPMSRIKGVQGETRCKFGRVHTLVVEVQGRRDLKIHFFDITKRDEAVEQVLRFRGIALERRAGGIVASPQSISPVSSFTDIPSLAHVQQKSASGSGELIASAAATTPPEGAPLLRHQSTSSLSTSPSHSRTKSATRSPSSILAPLSRLPSAVHSSRNGPILRALFPKAINVPEEVLLPMPSKHFVCLTIGSRGDVQPYIALGKGLQKEGHKVTVVTHEEYKEWVTGFGIGHRTAGGDPTALMKLSVENKVCSCSSIVLYDGA